MIMWIIVWWILWYNVVRVLSVIVSDEFKNGIICVEKHSHKYNQRDVNKKTVSTTVWPFEYSWATTLDCIIASDDFNSVQTAVLPLSVNIES